MNDFTYPLLTIPKTLVLVGMPGAGKSSVGRRLAARLGLEFFDSDAEVEAAAGMKIAQIFGSLGEPEFRQGERRVIARLMDGPPHVLATGGGALMDESTRELVKNRGISIWLNAPIEVLLERTSRRADRPLLQQGDAEIIMRNLLMKREPIYAESDIVVVSDHHPTDETVERVVSALNKFCVTAQHEGTTGGFPHPFLRGEDSLA